MIPESDLSQELTRVHSLTLSLYWGLSLDISAVATRYFKHYSWYIPLHAVWMSLQSLFSLALMLYMLVTKWSVIWAGTSSRLLAHGVIGLLLALLLTSQLVLGAMLKARVLSPELRSIWGLKLAHQMVFAVIWVLAKTQIVIGLFVVGKDRTGIIIGISFTVMVIALLLIEFVFRMRPGFLLPSSQDGRNLTPYFK
jgi:hypothetical protein